MLNQVDHAALRAAVEELRGRGGDREWIEGKLKRESFEQAAASASYACQVRVLRLAPWQWPPAWIDDVAATLRVSPSDHTGRHQMAVLVQKLLAAGLSRFEPDPIGALERASALAS